MTAPEWIADGVTAGLYVAAVLITRAEIRKDSARHR